MSKKKVVLPDLFKKTSTGAIQVWSEWTVGNAIFTEWGHVNGSKQQTTETIANGKNVGKKNETTPEEQAQAEAKSRWELKLKKGYVESAGGAAKGELNSVIEGGIFPMLAHVYEDNVKHAKYPAFIQPKLDGHRCIAIYKDSKCTLWSRTRKRINSVPHIERAVEAACKEAELDDATIDGELYNHAYKDKFEELTSLIRQSEPGEKHEEVKFYVYDFVNNAEFSSRVTTLNKIFRKLPPAIVVVPTFDVSTEEEMYDKFYDFVKDGYEGAIYRSKNGLYVNKRSRDLLKVKEFLDGEFLIVDVEEGRGKMSGHAVFICNSTAGTTFKVKMAATQDQLKTWYADRATLIGKYLTIKYQGLTNSSIPRFPVGLRFREDI